MTTQTKWAAEEPFHSFSRTALIINPKSGSKANAALKARIRHFATDIGMKVFQPSSIGELNNVIEAFPSLSLQNVAILGGDGTIDLVLQAVRKVFEAPDKPRIVILGGGTMNVLATNLRHRRTIETLFSHFVQALRESTHLPTVALRPLDVNGQLGFVFASGAAVAFLKRYYEISPHPKRAAKLFFELALRGLWKGYADPLFSKIFQSEKIHIRRFLNHSTEHFPFEESRVYESILASTLPRLTPLVAMFKGTPLRDENFARMMAIGEKGSVKTLTLETLQILLGWRKGLHEGNFQEVLLEAEHSTEYSLDGEIYEAKDGRIAVTLGPSFEFVILA